MSASEQTDEEGSSHAAAAEHPLAAFEWLASRVLSLIDDAREVCRLALVNRTFYDASSSDTVWEKRLPQLDHLTAIYSNAIHQHLLHLSKRDLYLKLCSSVLSDDGLQRFWIDPASGGGCYMISARALSICWGENPTYWRWTPWRGAMFEEVAYLDAVCWFDISGVFRQVLKPGNYRVSFRMQLHSSWGNTPITLSLEDTASAHPPHVSEVFFDGRTKFKRRRCIPLAQILEPENVTPVTNDGNELDHAQDGIDIGEEGAHDRDGSDDGHDHTADGLNGNDDHESYENDLHDGGGDGSGRSDNHNNEDDNECEDDDDEDSGDDDDVYDEKLLYIEEQHIHNDDNCEKDDDDDGADANGDSDKHDNDNDDKCEDHGDEDSTDDDDEDSNEEDDDLLLEDDDEEHICNNNVGVHKWLELDVGQFSVQDHNEEQPVEIKFRMQEIIRLWWKSGFVLDGVIIRPAIVADMAELE